MKISALVASLAPFMAKDAKMEDVLAAVNVSLAADKKARDEANGAAEDKAAMDKAAKDAGYEDAEDKAACDKAAKDAGCDPKDMVKGKDGNWGLGSKDGLHQNAKDQSGELDDDIDASDATPGKPVDGTAAALDAAVKLAVDAAITAERALAAAREEVKPLLGNVTTFDSADAVYGAALDHLKIDHKGVHASALRSIYQAATKQAPALAADAKSVKTMDEAFPHLNRLRR